MFNDTTVEGDETFDLTFTVPQLFDGRITAGSRDSAIGDITDTSSKLHSHGITDHLQGLILE